MAPGGKKSSKPLGSFRFSGSSSEAAHNCCTSVCQVETVDAQTEEEEETLDEPSNKLDDDVSSTKGRATDPGGEMLASFVSLDDVFHRLVTWVRRDASCPCTCGSNAALVVADVHERRRVATTVLSSSDLRRYIMSFPIRQEEAFVKVFHMIFTRRKSFVVGRGDKPNQPTSRVSVRSTT